MVLSIEKNPSFLVKRKNQPVKIKEDRVCLFTHINARSAIKKLK